MRAFGAELIEHGHDFHDADAHGEKLAASRKLHRVLSFHPLLVRGVASSLWSCSRLCPTWTLFTFQWAGVRRSRAGGGAERSGTENEDYCSRLQ